MAKTKKEQTEELADALAAPPPRVPPLIETDLLSTGSTLLNVALTGTPGGGVPKGCFLYLVGDSGSLKTWLTLSLFAEAARSPRFARHRLVYDAPENGAIMSIPHYFGRRMAERLEPPAGKRDAPTYSRTVQELYYHVDAALDRGPCVYALDSMDALNDEADEEVFTAERKKYETGKGTPPGSYGTAKAKTNSQNIARVVQRLRDTGSILVVISQTRDRIGSHIPGLKTRGGGRALKFYSHLEVWSSVRGALTARHHGRDLEIGTLVRLDVQKNRVTGWEGKIEIPFLKGHGIDDVKACVDYLIEERHWREEKDGTVTAPEFSFTGGVEELVAHVQTQGDEHELGLLVARVWREVLAQITPERKPRYT